MCAGHKKRARSLRVLRAAQRSSPRAGRCLDQNRRVGKGSAGFSSSFRPSLLWRLGRNEQLKALAPSNTSSFPRRVFCARVLFFGFAHPSLRGGGAPRVVRVLARHPLGLHVTRQARRWRGALRPSEDARLPALHRGGFWLRCRAFPHRTCVRIGPSELLAPGRSARRRRSVPPGAAVTSRCRGTPRLAPRSGRLENTPLNEHGCERSSAVASRSQYP